MKSIEAAREYWNQHATRDPLWAVLSDSSKTDRRWDLASFMQTGEREIALLFHELNALGLAVSRDAAVDFGCGVGRLTQALARRFGSVLGLDVSSGMIRIARQINKYGDRVTYETNDGSLAARIQESSVDFVYSTLVLQHMHPDISSTYVSELVKSLRPGGLFVFQLPVSRTEALRGPVPMPEPAYRAAVLFARPLPGKIEASSSFRMSVEIVNLANTTWSMADFGGIRAGNHWLDAGAGMVIQDDGRASLPALMRPGERCRIELEVRAPAHPGQYILELDVVHEGISWFADRGSRTARAPVTVVVTAGAQAATDGLGSGVLEAGEPSPIAVPDYSDVALDSLLPAPDSVVAPADFPMHAIPREQVGRIVTASGGEVVHVVDDDHAKPEWNGYKYFVRKPL
jgi:SAM-dependent methyltransferase